MYFTWVNGNASDKFRHRPARLQPILSLMSQNKCKKFCSQKWGAVTHSQLQIRGALVYVQREIICKIQTRETCFFVKVLLCFFCAFSQYCFQILPGTSHLLIHPFKSPDQIKRKAYIDFAKKNLQRINIKANMSNQNGDSIKKVSENLNTQCFKLHRDD